MTGLSGARSPRWLFSLLDWEWRELGVMGNILGGSFDSGYQDALGYSAKIQCDREFDWTGTRCRITYDPGVDGIMPWVIGSFVFSAPSKAVGADSRTTRDVDLLSPLVLLDRDKLRARFSAEEGTPIRTAIQQLLDGSGTVRYVLADTDANLTAMFVAEVGDSRLTAINALCDVAGLEPAWVDELGVVHISEYVAPLDRPVAWTFADGEAAIHSPEWSQTIDIDAIKNVWVVFGQGSEDEDPISGIAINADPDHPYSTVSLGYRNVGVTSGITSDDESVYPALAAQYLQQSLVAATQVSVSHAIVPLRPGQNVRFAPVGQPEMVVTIQKVSHGLEFDAQVTADWVEAVEIVKIDEVEDE